MISLNAFGGLNVDQNTLKVNGLCNQYNIYSLGPINKGELFYVTAVEAITRDARTINLQLEREINDETD